MNPLAIGLSSAASGLLNLLSGSSSRDEQNKKLDKYKALINDLKIDDLDKLKRLDIIDDTFNTLTEDTLNQSSIGLATSGLMNPEGAKAVILQRALGSKAKAKLNESSKIDEFNKSIALKEAEVELSRPEGNGISDFFSGAVEGVGLGLSIDDYIFQQNYQNKFMDLLGKDTADNTNKSTIASIFDDTDFTGDYSNHLWNRKNYTKYGDYLDK